MKKNIFFICLLAAIVGLYFYKNYYKFISSPEPPLGTPYADGGKRCTDSTQCLGRCIYEDEKNSEYLKFAKSFRGAGKHKVTGICERDNYLYKCLSEVKNNYIYSPIYCADP